MWPDEVKQSVPATIAPLMQESLSLRGRWG